MNISTEYMAQKFYKKIETDFKVKFVSTQDSFIYKIVINSIAKKLGVLADAIDYFVKKFAIAIYLPFKGSVVLLPYSKDSNIISPTEKIVTATHELQHIIDAQKDGMKKWYRMYMSNGTFRATKEARGFGADMEAEHMLSGKTGMVVNIPYTYFIFGKDKEIFDNEIRNVNNNLVNSPSFEASKYLKSFLDSHFI